MAKKISRLFSPSRENLIDEAAQANAAQSSPDPAAQISAVDFDKELQELVGNQAQADEANGDMTNPDGGEADLGGDGGDSGGGDNPSGDEAPPTEEGDNPETTDEEPPTEGEEQSEGGVPEDIGNPPNTQMATECVTRLVRTLEALDEAHDTAIVSPTLALLANQEADRVGQMLDLEMPSAPALENQSGESMYTTTRARVMEILKKALAVLMKWWNNAAAWTKEFLNEIRVQNGNYPKTIDGYRRRLEVLKSVVTDEQVELALGALSHNFNTNEIADLGKATTLGNSIALNIAVGCANASIDDMATFRSLYDPAKLADNSNFNGIDVGQLRFPSVPQTFKITPVSNAISNDASLNLTFKDRTGDAPGAFKMTGVPGNKTLGWVFGHVDKRVSDMESVVRQLQVFRFIDEQTTNTNTTLTVAATADTAKALLAIAEAAQKNDATLTKIVGSISKRQAMLAKMVQDVLVAMQRDKNVHPRQAQDLSRIGALWVSAIERCYTTPVFDMVKMSQRYSSQAIKLAAQIVAVLEKKYKEQQQARQQQA